MSLQIDAAMSSSKTLDLSTIGSGLLSDDLLGEDSEF